MQYLSFGLFMLMAQFSPGPDMLLLLKNSLNHSLQAGLWTVMGIVVGLTIHTTLALTGVSLILRSSPAAASVVSIAGGFYLGWLAFQLLRSVFRKAEVKPEGEGAVRELPLSSRAAFLQGLITNLLNPKAVLFLLSVLATWAAAGSSTGHKLALGGIILGQALVFWSLFVWLLKRGPVRRFYLRSERVLNGLFGLGLSFIAVAAVLRPFIGWANL
jgi:threonine/homoserine/homoserine lactone efflux protein